jgi:hypothetical protein
VTVKVPWKALATGVALVLLAAYTGWQAMCELFESRRMTIECGMAMTNFGIARVSTGLLVAGVLLHIGISVMVKALGSRRDRDSDKTAA